MPTPEDSGQVTSSEFPHMDVVEQGQPPEEMQDYRLVPVPERKYTPFPFRPGDVLVVRAEDFMAVIREMAGSSVHSFRQYAAKMEGAVVLNAHENFANQLQRAYQDGMDAANFTLGESAAAEFEASLDHGNYEADELGDHEDADEEDF